MSADDQKPGATTEDTKPDASAEQLNIKVRDGEGAEVQFKIKKSTPLKKLMDSYCSRMGAERQTYRFLFDGDRIKDDDTPTSLEMEDEDVIDALLHQLGGAE